jgi:sugar transferase EpsL
MHNRPVLDRPVSLSVKRLLDVVGAIVGFVILSPLLAAAALAVLRSLGRPILFTQVRTGLHGKSFRIYKFRTMRPPRDGEVWFRTDDQRLSPIGRFLRRTSIDELPELWNVLRGEMSLVGPRPLLPEYLAAYTPEQARRHEMRPGITGWAQVQGRQSIPFSRRLELDVWYIDHFSLPLDLRILAMTVRDVLLTRGVKPGQNIDEIDDLNLAGRVLDQRPSTSKGPGRAP